jgi:hypothetical protein
VKKIFVTLLVVVALSVFVVPAALAQVPALESAQIVAQHTQPPVEDGNVACPFRLKTRSRSLLDYWWLKA